MFNPADHDILVVDDDEDIRVALAEHLDGEGYATRTASSGIDAVRQMRERRPDLILLDVMMPGHLDGFGVMEAMKNLYTRNRPSVILVTAVADAGRVQTAIKHGITDILVKPFKLRDVTARIEKLLGANPGVAGASRAGAGGR